MRAVLEGTAAGPADRSASEIEIEEPVALNHELAALGDSPEVVLIIRQFHASILDAAKNRLLDKSVHSLQKTLLILGRKTLKDAGRTERSVEEHFGILDAIKVRDGTLAEAVIRTHIERAQRVRIRALRSTRVEY